MRGSIVGLAILVLAAVGWAADDAFIRGYASAIVEREFQLRRSAVEVQDGVVTVRASGVVAADRSRMEGALAEIPGVVRVEIVDEEPPAFAAVEKPAAGGVFLPSGWLFEPLVADPRWPHFSIGYFRYFDDPELENVGSVTFGESFAVYRDQAFFGGDWEIGIQGGVFAIFDLDAPSGDLVNADYLGGVPIAWRNGPYSVLVRLFHQSSHLGDEFVLRGRARERVNLSYEQADLKLSWDPVEALRLYAGAGVLLRREPEALDRGSAQYGLELELPTTLPVRPVLGADVQHREEGGWRADFSLRGGLELASTPVAGRKLHLMFEYFDGRSPNGQFYEREIEYFGVAGHLHF